MLRNPLAWTSQPQTPAPIARQFLPGLALVADAGESQPRVGKQYPSKDPAGYTLLGTRQPGPSGMGWVGASGVNVSAKTSSTNPDELLQLASGTDFTLQFVVDNVGIASGTNPGWFRVGSSSGGTTFLVTNATTRRPWLRVGGTDILKPAAGNQWTDGTTVNLIVVFRSGASAEIWFNGEQQYTTTHSTATPALSGTTDGFYTLLTNSGTETLRANLSAFRAWRRALPVDQVRSLARNPWALYAPRLSPVFWDIPSSSGSTGTSATTNANDTSSAAGTTTVTGTVARTNANDTSSASGTTTVLGTLATTNADDTSSASGTVGGGSVTGTSATTSANDAGAAAGTTTVVGASATTNASDTSSAAGTTTIVGTSTRTNANDTATASGVAGVVSGSAAVTNADDTSAASGTSGTALPRMQGAGKSKRQKRVIEIDGRDVVVGSTEEAQALLESLKEDAQQKAAIAIQRAANAPNRKPRKVLADARRFLQVPAIEAPGLENEAAQALRDIEAIYRSAMVTVEVAALLAKRQREEEDDEDVLLLIA